MDREEFAWLNQIMDMMEAHFGRDVELVLHDLKKDYTQTIIDIRNGGITGRKIGDGGDNLGLGVIRGTEKNGNKFNYINYTEDGKTLKSSTLFLRDKAGKPVYALAINEDVTQMWKFEQYLKEKNQSGREADHIVRDYWRTVWRRRRGRLEKAIARWIRWISRPILNSWTSAVFS